jgi:hypothetical protein
MTNENTPTPDEVAVDTAWMGRVDDALGQILRALYGGPDQTGRPLLTRVEDVEKAQEAHAASHKEAGEARKIADVARDQRILALEDARHTEAGTKAVGEFKLSIAGKIGFFLLLTLLGALAAGVIKLAFGVPLP